MFVVGNNCLCLPRSSLQWHLAASTALAGAVGGCFLAPRKQRHAVRFSHAHDAARTSLNIELIENTEQAVAPARQEERRERHLMCLAR